MPHSGGFGTTDGVFFGTLYCLQISELRLLVGSYLNLIINLVPNRSSGRDNPGCMLSNCVWSK